VPQAYSAVVAQGSAITTALARFLSWAALGIVCMPVPTGQAISTQLLSDHVAEKTTLLCVSQENNDVFDLNLRCSTIS
jgi:hypothetical protein